MFRAFANNVIRKNIRGAITGLPSPFAYRSVVRPISTSNHVKEKIDSSTRTSLEIGAYHSDNNGHANAYRGHQEALQLGFDDLIENLGVELDANKTQSVDFRCLGPFKVDDKVDIVASLKELNDDSRAKILSKVIKDGKVVSIAVFDVYLDTKGQKIEIDDRIEPYFSDYRRLNDSNSPALVSLKGKEFNRLSPLARLDELKNNAKSSAAISLETIEDFLRKTDFSLGNDKGNQAVVTRASISLNRVSGVQDSPFNLRTGAIYKDSKCDIYSALFSDGEKPSIITSNVELKAINVGDKIKRVKFDDKLLDKLSEYKISDDYEKNNPIQNRDLGLFPEYFPLHVEKKRGSLNVILNFEARDEYTPTEIVKNILGVFKEVNNDEELKNLPLFFDFGGKSSYLSFNLNSSYEPQDLKSYFSARSELTEEIKRHPDSRILLKGDVSEEVMLMAQEFSQIFAHDSAKIRFRGIKGGYLPELSNYRELVNRIGLHEAISCLVDGDYEFTAKELEKFNFVDQIVSEYSEIYDAPKIDKIRYNGNTRFTDIINENLSKPIQANRKLKEKSKFWKGSNVVEAIEKANRAIYTTMDLMSSATVNGSNNSYLEKLDGKFEDLAELYEYISNNVIPQQLPYEHRVDGDFEEEELVHLEEMAENVRPRSPVSFTKSLENETETGPALG